MEIEVVNESLKPEQLELMKAFAKACRRSIMAMLANSQSGHPGGSLSSIDFLTVLYTQIISKTGEKIVISNGHISPAIYSILAELGYISKDEVIKNFRKMGSIFEGHVTRHVPGIWYGTGPLGIGAAVASAMAWGERHTGVERKVFGVIGDGEAQEGEVYEMMNFAAKYKLDNFILFCDYNQVQLSDSLLKVMPLNLKGHFEAAGWRVIEVDGHDFESIWSGLGSAYQPSGSPVLILAKTVMGKGIDFMEKDGQEHKATWHGKTASLEQTNQIIGQFDLNENESAILNEFRKKIAWKPEPMSVRSGEKMGIKVGIPRLYGSQESLDCRTAYGNALLDLAELNSEIVALDADLKGSTMTKFLGDKYPDRLIQCGIAEQLMVSVAGGLSLTGLIPFASTFGAFISSRAKDQARVNDINLTNVKMVATHAGLSVGEDGPTHQAIDDMGSFLGMFHTNIIEPADPNQTDRIIRYIANQYGNYYVRMGRHKYPVLLKEDGQPFYGVDYVYEYGKTDLIRSGGDLTIIATGATVYEAMEAWKIMSEKGKPFNLVAVSSIKQFDKNLLDVVARSSKIITIEDHNLKSGLHGQIALWVLENGLKLDLFAGLGVKEYQLSGKADELYAAAGFYRKNIVEYIDKL